SACRSLPKKENRGARLPADGIERHYPGRFSEATARANPPGFPRMRLRSWRRVKACRELREPEKRGYWVYAPNRAMPRIPRTHPLIAAEPFGCIRPEFVHKIANRAVQKGHGNPHRRVAGIPLAIRAPCVRQVAVCGNANVTCIGGHERALPVTREKSHLNHVGQACLQGLPSSTFVTRIFIPQRS